jgi:hypothetical protein
VEREKPEENRVRRRRRTVKIGCGEEWQRDIGATLLLLLAAVMMRLIRTKTKGSLLLNGTSFE